MRANLIQLKNVKKGVQVSPYNLADERKVPDKRKKNVAATFRHAERFGTVHAVLISMTRSTFLTAQKFCPFGK